MSVKITYHKTISVANLLDKTEAENEDFVSIIPMEDGPYSKYVISDGAGGAGVFSKEWACFLGNNVPQDPIAFTQSSINWFNDISKQFYETIIAKQDLSDLMLQKKVFKEGSYSTLTACWIDKDQSQMYISSVGDSCLFYFERVSDTYKLKFISSLNKQNEIDDFPELLNWNIEQNNPLPVDCIYIEDEFKIVLASDSLAKWILLNLSILDYSMLSEAFFKPAFLASLNSTKYQERRVDLKLNSSFSTINDFMIFLRKITVTNDEFINSLKELYDNKEIDMDDYSIIYIEGDVSK